MKLKVKTKPVKPPTPKTTYVLKLSESEALALWAVTRNISGPLNSPVRVVTDKIGYALADALNPFKYTHSHFGPLKPFTSVIEKGMRVRRD